MTEEVEKAPVGLQYPVGLADSARRSADRVVEELATRIRSGDLQCGDKLPTETEIMRAYGVSRTVAREAITRLQAERLVETRHGIGTFVLELPAPAPFVIDPRSVVTLQDVLSILELRMSLETEVASLAAMRRSETQLTALRGALDALLDCRARCAGTAAEDADFHLAIAEAAANPRIHSILHHLGKNIIPRSRINFAALTQEDLHRVAQEHEDIFDAIRRQDPETARAAMRSHLSNSRERLLRAYRGATD